MRNGRFNQKHNRYSNSPRDRREPPAPYVPKPLVTYGKPMLILEDPDQQTFELKSGAWVPFAMSIAECRRECQVKELPQKINRMTR